MGSTSPQSKLDAWLTTLHSAPQSEVTAPTLCQESSQEKPLLEAFRSFGESNTAAPLLVKSTLAEGGMGVVKLAEQSSLGRSVVVKTLRNQQETEAAEHILREAWATGSLEHPNIVPVHDIRVDETGAPMIVLKRIEGETWTALMHNTELVQERFESDNLLEWNLDILRQVVQAVRFSHSRGILHRDLKPDNVMIGSFGEVYLVDWGIAMSLGDGESRLPRAQDSCMVGGTPCYMSPEMLNATALDERTDVYLLGSLLFEILSGRPPHSTDSLESLLRDIRNSEPKFPEGSCPILRALCKRAMSRRPEDRFESANVFFKALKESREHRTSVAMAEVAKQGLTELSVLLDADSQSRHEVYQLFGAIRLGYVEALKTWPGNQEVLLQLDQARCLVIEYELANENPIAAQDIYEALLAPKPSLQEAISQALLAQESEHEELKKFRINVDLSVGHRTRIWLIAMLGVVWVAVPLFQSAEAISYTPSYRNSLLSTHAFALIYFGLWYWARRSLNRTQVNRRLIRSLGTVFVCQALLYIGTYQLKVPHFQAEPLKILVWLIVTANVTTTIDRRFWPAVIGYIATFLVATTWPAHMYLAMAGGNFTMTCTAIYVWRPRKSHRV